MKVLIVYAHHEPMSFGAALLQRSTEVLTRCGHELIVSDLHAMNFNPVATAADFSERRFPEALQYDREQKFAHQRGAFADDIQAEIDKLLWCDFLILQFPLWWFSVPAILKGWIDRVFVNGVVYGSGRRFDTGGLKGRRGMLVTTTACLPGMVEPDGLLGSLDANLWHLNHGTLGYAGITVLPTFAAWSIHYTTADQRATYLEEYERMLLRLEQIEPMPTHALDEFGDDWRLRPGIEPRTAIHRRPGRAA
jgi:NAD(P)H dehydrogenase (quinone)